MLLEAEDGGWTGGGGGSGNESLTTCNRSRFIHICFTRSSVPETRFFSSSKRSRNCAFPISGLFILLLLLLLLL